MDNIKEDSYYKNFIVTDIEKILQYVGEIGFDEFVSDEQLIDAVLFRLIQITENIKKLSTDFRNAHKEIEWNEIIGFRNRIVHDYGKTDYSVVYEVVTGDINKLIKVLK